MRLTTYRDLVKLSKDKASELLAGPRVKEQKMRAELEMAKIDSQLAEKEQRLHELSGQYPIDFDGLVNCIDSIALLERRKRQFGRIVQEMFD